MAGICSHDFGLEDAERLFSIVNKFGSSEYKNQLMYQYKNKLSNILSLKEVEFENNNDSFILVHNLYECFWQSENKEWKKRKGIVGSTDCPTSSTYSNNSTDAVRNEEKPNVNFWIGEQFLWHGSSLREIFSVFSEVDPKSCGFNLKTVDGSIRKVSKHFKHLGNRRASDAVSAIGPERVNSKKRKRTVARLPEKEESTYRHALYCALNTCLVCVAKEPSPTPLPHGQNGSAPIPIIEVDDFIVGDVGSITNNTQMLVLKLKRAFQLSSYLHENIYGSIEKHSASLEEMLAADLTDLRHHIKRGHLTIPRTADDLLPDYQPENFSSIDVYNEWYNSQMTLVQELIIKWCQKYEQFEVCKPFRFDAYAEYKCLLQKLFKYDFDEKNSMARASGAMRTFILASDSESLLREFSLRYGVTKSYQYLSHLECLIENFHHSDWYLACINQMLTDVCEFVRNNKIFIVNNEWKMLLKVFALLHCNVKYCLSKIFSVYKKTLFVNGVNSMVLILSKMIEIRNELELWDSYEERQLEDFLREYFRESAILHYSQQRELTHLQYKIFYEDDDNDEDSGINATKLRLILQIMKQSVFTFSDLCNSMQCPLLQIRRDSLISIVGKAFYREYQEDIVELCRHAPVDVTKVDSQMIGLALRIDTLDKDWKTFISPAEQIWRTHFGIILTTVLTVLKEYWLGEIPKFILVDNMKILDLKEHQPPPQVPIIKIPTDSENERILISPSQERSSPFTPSVDSAFIKVDPIKKLQSELRKGSIISITGPLTLPRDESTYHSEDINSDTNDHQDSAGECEEDFIIPTTTETMNKELHFEREAENNVNHDAATQHDVHNYSENNIQHFTSSSHSQSDISKNEEISTLSTSRYPRIGPLALPEDGIDSQSTDLLKDKNSLQSTRPCIKREICRNYIKPDFIADISYLELPAKGTVMTTSSLCDVLVVCSRIISFTQEVSDLVVPSPPLTTETQHFDKSTQDDLTKLRENNFGKVLSCIGELFQQYSSVLMSLDVCGSQMYSSYYENTQAHLMKDSQQKKMPDLPGCRHSLKYKHKQTHSYEANHCIFLRLLLKQSLGDWELITKEMCYRINNTYALLTLLPYIQHKVAERLDIDLEPFLHALDGGKTTSSLYSTQGPSTSSVTYPQSQELSFELQPCRDFLQNIIQVQMKLLISRVMDIFFKLFEHLYNMKMTGKSIEEKMSPCLRYLSQQMKFFQYTLYEDCLREITLTIWKNVTDKYHEVIRRFFVSKENPQRQGRELYCLLTSQYLMIREYLNIDPHDNDLISAIYDESRLIFFRLEIFLMSSQQLKEFYNYMENSLQIRHILLNMDHLTLEECFYHVSKSLTDKCKSFTGRDFIKVITDNENILKSFTHNAYKNTMQPRMQEKSKTERAEYIGKYFLQQDWMICRKENFEIREPLRLGMEVIVSSESPAVRGRLIGNAYIYDEDVDDEEDEYVDGIFEKTRRSHSDGMTVVRRSISRESFNRVPSMKVLFKSQSSTFSVANTSTFSELSYNDDVNENDDTNYWDVDYEIFHLNGIYVFNMTDKSRLVTLAGKFYDILRCCTDRQLVLDDIQKDVRGIMGYLGKMMHDTTACRFFQDRGLLNPYLRSNSCFW